MTTPDLSRALLEAILRCDVARTTRNEARAKTPRARERDVTRAARCAICLSRPRRRGPMTKSTDTSALVAFWGRAHPPKRGSLREKKGNSERFTRICKSLLSGFGESRAWQWRAVRKFRTKRRSGFRANRRFSSTPFRDPIFQNFQDLHSKKTWSFRETAFDTKKTRKRRNGTSEPRLTGHFTVKKWAKVVHTLDQANPGCEFIARLSSADGRKPIFDRLFAHRDRKSVV